MASLSVQRRLAIAIVVSIAFGACQSVPTPTASTRPSAPSSISAAAGESANALRDAVDIDSIMADLQRLQSIADEHGGTRHAGSDGHEASASFVADELRAAGYDVELQPVTLPVFVQTGPSVLQIMADGATALEDIHDFKAMTFSASGDVTANIYALGFDPTAKPGDRNGRGCDALDWAAVPSGVIVLAQPGPCRRLDVVLRAQAAGVVALVTSYADWPRDGVLRPTLVTPADVHIPVIGTTPAAGLVLYDASMQGQRVHVVTATLTEQRTSMNVIGETPDGDPGRVVMLGGHLDSVIDGPGINDNGSGTMTVLEIARELAALGRADAPTRPTWKVRVAFWTGEEIGLYGSATYARALNRESAGRIQAYLNFDMLGSPNGIRVIYDDGTTNPPGGAVIADLLQQALESESLAWEKEFIGAVSDHYPLEQAGVPTGGLYSGANEVKSPTQESRYGGTAGLPNDACYHLACDTIDNVDQAWLEQMARAAAWVVGALASGTVDLAST
jgi:Peptidase family M28